MPRVLKAKRGKAKASTKTVARPKTKTRKKAKLQTTTMRASKPLKLPDKIKRAEQKPLTVQTPAPATEKKSDILKPEALPTTNFKLEVDGRLKSEYPTQQSAMTAAAELKRKYPHIRVAVVDAKGGSRITVELPLTAA